MSDVRELSVEFILGLVGAVPGRVEQSRQELFQIYQQNLQPVVTVSTVAVVLDRLRDNPQLQQQVAAILSRIQIQGENGEEVRERLRGGGK